MVDWEAHECATFNSPACATKEKTTLDILDVSDQRRDLRKKEKKQPKIKVQEKSSEVQHQEGEEGSKNSPPSTSALKETGYYKILIIEESFERLRTKSTSVPSDGLNIVAISTFLWKTLTKKHTFYHRWEAHVQPVFFIHGSDRKHHIKLQDLTDECLPHGDCFAKSKFLVNGNGEGETSKWTSTAWVDIQLSMVWGYPLEVVCKEFSEATVARAGLDRIAIPSGLPSSTDCTSTSSFQSRGMNVRCGPCKLKRKGE